MAHIEISDTEGFLTEPPAKKLKSINGTEIAMIKVKWSETEMNKLLEIVSAELGEDKMERHHITAFKDINWSKVVVGDRDSEQCKEQWGQLMKKVRKYRTASEVINDSKSVILTFINHQNDFISQPKDLQRPKKPLPPTFRYVDKYREKYKQAHPDVPAHLVQKVLAEKFASLPEKKKQKYTKQFQSEMEEWKVVYEAYLEEHPERRVEPLKKPKFWTPMMLYVHEMTDKHGPEDEEDDSEMVKKLSEKYKNKWQNGTSESRKIKYIQKALEMDQLYQKEVKKYCERHPKFKPINRPVLTKAERHLKDKFDGKPDKPPSTGFFLFIKENSHDMTHMSLQQRSTQLSKRWRELSEEERSAWVEKHRPLQEEYLQKLRKYVDGLPEEERPKYDAIFQKNVKKRKIKVEKQDNAKVTEIADSDDSD